MGFWAALHEVYGKTRGQRCWVHKTANVLNGCQGLRHWFEKPLATPKSVQPKAKAHLKDIWMAETKAEADIVFDFFVEAYGVKYAKTYSKWRAVKCLIKDRTDLLAFYDFPAEHSHDRSQAFSQGNLPGGTSGQIVWMCKAGGGTETTVEQTLIRGLVTA